MKDLPNDVIAYKKTPEFDESTVPKGLLKAHQTKVGVWGKINILAGQLEYSILEPELETVVLSTEQHGVVEPTVLHQVKPLGKVRFYVEFYQHP
ncbi:DUF1971 domain-containing protein [Dasania marina]|uniref:DUF1971 domain-containing protein n=1 Tax=Dasania marina TaxID=471499 RepID=UPI0030DDB1CB|tara:strand:- start:11747 stop:12028 length:282 start_codon:yes stop_codon:yes gene_type:complete